MEMAMAKPESDKYTNGIFILRLRVPVTKNVADRNFTF